MARETGTRKRSTESRLIFTVLGVTVWIVTGFVVGLVAGVVSEEPELIVGHMAGRDTEIAWAAGGGLESAGDDSLAPVAAGPQTSLLENPPPPSEPVIEPESDTESHARAPVAPRVMEKKTGAPRVASTSVNSPRFLIQVGAYDSRDSAQEVAETLRGKGYAVQVLSAADDGRFRVRVGPVAARERAEGLAKRLESDEGLPTWILRQRES